MVGCWGYREVGKLGSTALGTQSWSTQTRMIDERPLHIHRLDMLFPVHTLTTATDVLRPRNADLLPRDATSVVFLRRQPCANIPYAHIYPSCATMGPRHVRCSRGRRCCVTTRSLADSRFIHDPYQIDATGEVFRPRQPCAVFPYTHISPSCATMGPRRETRSRGRVCCVTGGALMDNRCIHHP